MSHTDTVDRERRVRVRASAGFKKGLKPLKRDLVIRVQPEGCSIKSVLNENRKSVLVENRNSNENLFYGTPIIFLVAVLLRTAT